MNNRLTFRSAERKDVSLILGFIKELADYEKMLDEVVADEATLETWIFDKQKAEFIFALEGEKKSALRCFSIISPLFSDEQKSIWRTYMSSLSTAEMGTEKRF